MLKKDVAVTFSGSVVALVLGTANSIIVARALGPTDRGRLALALLIPTITSTFMRFGQETVNVTYAGLYKDKRQTLFLHSLIIVLASAVLNSATIWGFFWLPIDRGELSTLPAIAVNMACIYGPIVVMMTVMNNLVRGIGKVRMAVFLGLVQMAFNLVLMVVLLRVYRMGYVAALTATTLSPLLSVIMALWVLRDVMTFRLKAFDWAFFKKCLSFGSLTAGADFASFLVYRIDQLILNYLVSPEKLGLYVVAVQSAERLKMVPASISTAFLPRLTNQLAERQARTPAIFRYSAVVSLLAVLASLLLGPIAIATLFGKQYVGAIFPFLVLLPGVGMIGIATIIWSDLIARGVPKYAFIVSWVTALLSIILNLVTINLIGIIGAALSGSICYAVDLFMSMSIYSTLAGVPFKTLIPSRKDFVYVVHTGFSMVKELVGLASKDTKKAADL